MRECAHANTDLNTYGYTDRNPYVNTHIHTDGNSDRYTHIHTDRNRNCNPDGICNGDSDCDRDGHAHGNAHADADGDPGRSDRDPNRNTNPNPNRNADCGEGDHPRAMSSEARAMNGKWARTVAATVVAAVIIFILRMWYGHFAQASDTTELAEQTAKSHAEVVELVKILGERAKAEDAQLEQDAKRCRQGKITDREICGAAGVELP